jgi:hypothetical protein
MLKRVGMLGLALTAAAVFLQPVAFAAERGYGRDPRFNRHDERRVVEQYREPVRRYGYIDNFDHERRIVIRTPVRDHWRAPVYYAPECGY